MFNALYFEYDGVFSGDYGLQILDLGGGNTETSNFITLDVKTSKPSKKKTFVYNGVDYSKPPTHRFQIIGQTPIPDTERRQLLSWLLGRGEFKKLVIFQPDLDKYYFNCIFSNIDLIYVNGECVGFELSATFDSPYAYGEDTTYEITGDGSIQTISIINNSDIIDGYVYPTMSFTIDGDLSDTDVNGANKSIAIINTTDNKAREFYFTGLSVGVEYSVDNELKILSPTTQNNLLGKFSKRWLRLRQGINNLTVKINGTLTIKCPQYVIIGL